MSFPTYHSGESISMQPGDLVRRARGKDRLGHVIRVNANGTLRIYWLLPRKGEHAITNVLPKHLDLIKRANT